MRGERVTVSTLIFVSWEERERDDFLPDACSSGGESDYFHYSSSIHFSPSQTLYDNSSTHDSEAHSSPGCLRFLYPMFLFVIVLCMVIV